MKINTGEELKKFRESLGLTQSDFAKLIGACKDVICRNEKRINISDSMFRKLDIYFSKINENL